MAEPLKELPPRLVAEEQLGLQGEASSSWGRPIVPAEETVIQKACHSLIISPRRVQPKSIGHENLQFSAYNLQR